MVPGVYSENRGNLGREERDACFVKKALERCRVFPERSVHEFYRLKALITLEEVNTSVVQKKKKNLYEQSFDGEANNK